MNNKNLIIVGIASVVVIIIGLVLYLLIGKNNTSTQQVTLVYWGLWEPESVMQPLIDSYEHLHPNVKIQYVQKPYTQYEANLYTRIYQKINDNTPAPDIVRIDDSWLSKYQSVLYPLPSDVMTAADYSNTFYPTAVTDFTGTDGKIYAIPLETDSLALYYNKKLFNAEGISQPPADWDTFIADAKKLTKTDSSGKITQAGAALGTSNNILHAADILNLLLLQNGVVPIDSTNTVVDFSSTRAVTALTFYTNFVKTNKTWSGDLASDLEVFYSGKLAMMFGPSWRAFDIINSNSSLDFAIAPAPQLPGNTPVNYAMYWGEAVPATSPNAKEAWKFIAYLSQPDNMKLLYSNESQIRAFGEPYSRQDLASELSTSTYAAAFITMAPTSIAWKMGEQSYVEDNLRTAINSVVVGGQEPAAALKTAQDSINAKLQEVIK